MDKIYTAKDRANELGFESYFDLLENITKTKISHEFADDTVNACIDFGRWIAHCENCRGSSYVDPSEDGFYCTACKNEKHDGKLLHVVFPENREEIEAEILKRNVNVPAGMFGTQGAANATGCPRSWNPGETVEDLHKQLETYGNTSKDELMTEYLRVLGELERIKSFMTESESKGGA